MRLRLYIHAADPRQEETVAAIDELLATLGEISERKSGQYWKIPEMIEVLRDFVPKMPPSHAFAAAMNLLGTGWTHNDESAHLTKLNDDAEFAFAGIRDIFLDIEPLDWARALGVMPRFTFEDEVLISAKNGRLADHVGKIATIKGHSFDYENTRTWGYAIVIEGESDGYYANDGDLEPMVNEPK